MPSVRRGSTCPDIRPTQRLHNIHTNELPATRHWYVIKDLFDGLDCMLDTYSIKVDPSVKPVIHPPRKVPISMK